MHSSKDFSALLENASWDRPLGTPAVRARHETVGEWIEANTRLIMYLIKTYGQDLATPTEELFQEACLHIWRAWEKYDVNRCDVKRSTFLSQVVKNIIWQQWRRENAKKRQASLPSTDANQAETITQTPANWRQRLASLHGLSTDPHGRDMDEILDARTKVRAIRVFLQKQPEVSRQAFHLCWELGYSQVEAAKKIGCSQSKVSLVLSALRKELKALLDGMEVGATASR
jgi:RNA polymerase sigma factor (sigma-70 family)